MKSASIYTSIRTGGLVAGVALALLAGSAQVQAMQVYMPYEGITTTMSAKDYAQQYSQARATLLDGGLVGVCLSDKGYNTGKCSRRMTEFELIVLLDNSAGTQAAGKSAVGGP